MDKLKMYMFVTEQSISSIFLQFWFRCIFYPHPPPTSQTVKKKFPWVYPFHEISCNFGSGVFFSPTPHPLAKQWKNIYSWIYPFHEISCNFGSGVFFTPTPTHWPNSEKIFFMDLSISWNFLQFWFRCSFYPHPPNSEKKFMDLSISWNFLLMITIARRYVGIWDRLDNALRVFLLRVGSHCLISLIHVWSAMYCRYFEVDGKTLKVKSKLSSVIGYTYSVQVEGFNDRISRQVLARWHFNITITEKNLYAPHFIQVSSFKQSRFSKMRIFSG